MSSLIIHQETIPLRVTAFKRFPVKAAIDRGSSLTKVAFTTKDSPDDADIIQLHCVTFLNDHFIDGVKFLKENAKLPAEGSLHVTGVGAATYRDQIKEIVGLDVTFINEMVTLGYGPYLFVNNCEPDDIFFPKPNYKKWVVESEMFDQVLKSTADKIAHVEGNFPALMLYVGSGAGVMRVNEDGSGSFTMGTALSGKPLMGLAHALVGTADYEELMGMAERGDGLKADMTIGELLKEDPDSPYGKFPPELPIFPFGKASNKSWDRSSCGPDDLAKSLLELFTAEIGAILFSSVNASGLNKVYVSGNVFRHELPRKLLLENIEIFGKGLNIDVKFLRTGHAGALAAMFLEPEDCAKLIK